MGRTRATEKVRRAFERDDALGSKTLLYVTRGYDPKNKEEILSGMGENVRFEQLRWHDFYRLLLTVEKDALVEEVMAFMEEQGMARSYRFSPTDLIALSGVPRAFEIFDETLGGEVRAELESFAGNKLRRDPHGLNQIRDHKRYNALVFLTPDRDLYCYVGYDMRTPDGYPRASVNLETGPGAMGREASVAAMKQISLREDWEGYNLDDPTDWAGVARGRSMVSLLQEEDHLAAVKRFFVESIRQLRGELTAFKKEHPDLPWTGG